MHNLSTSFVLGYHGCSAAVAEKVLAGEPFRPSQNDFDWLGEGAYFWESNPSRGLHYYRELCERKGRPSEDATVVGAVIDLKNCLDLTTSSGVGVLKRAYNDMKQMFDLLEIPVPINKGGEDLLLRRLDCAVINYAFNSRPFDTVRGIFLEGDDAYPGAGFREKTHSQIAVRNLACIKGVFRVKDSDLAD